MSAVSLSTVGVAILLITSLTLLLSRDWRLGIGALGVQYLGVFLLVSVTWPVNLAVIKLVAGWMAGAVMGLTYVSSGLGRNETKIWPTERLFRLLAAALVILVVLSLTPQTVDWVPNIGPFQVAGGLLLIGMGIMHHALTEHSLQALLGLMTALSGFEILYAAVESSALVAGLLAVVNLGIGLTGAYLLISPELEQTL